MRRNQTEWWNCRALKAALTGLGLTLTLWITPALGQSTTEAHVLFGSLKNPSFTGGGSTDTWTATVQHASGWAFGDLFVFFDLVNSEDASLDIYGEAYPSLSLARISGDRFHSARSVTLACSWGSTGLLLPTSENTFRG